MRVPEGLSTGLIVEPPGARVELRLLDGFSLCSEGHEVTLPLGAQRLLAFLSLQTGPLTRAYVAGGLWLDASHTRACANLRTALWRLRPLGLPIVDSTRTHLRLNGAVMVDYHLALSTVRRVIDPAGQVCGNELSVIAGELLPDWYDEWVVVERERLHLLRLHALEQLCRWFTSQGRFGEAIDAGMSAVAAEPLRETAHRALVEVHVVAGNRRAALQQYEGYARILSQQLRLLPSDEMEALIAPLRAPVYVLGPRLSNGYDQTFRGSWPARRARMRQTTRRRWSPRALARPDGR